MSDSTGKFGAGWKDIKYKQDLSPPGGYGRIPFIRNLPIRGPGGYAIFGMAAVIFLVGREVLLKNKLVDREEFMEKNEIEICLHPLIEAELDRTKLRRYKTMMESEALNIVGTGYDPDHEPGQDLYNIKRWREPRFQDNEYQLPMAINFWYKDIVRRPVSGP